MGRIFSTKTPGMLTEFVSDYVVFDLETTGISCSNDQIVEISGVKVIGGKVTDQFSTLVNPGRPIPWQASQVNGITDDMVADAPYIDDVLGDFLKFTGRLVLVGHNIKSFDLKFIYRESERLFGRTPINDYVDTLVLARSMFPDLPHHRLGDMADYFGLTNEQAHRALGDAVVNQKIYEKMGEMLKESPELLKKCPKCGCLMKKRAGKFGPFWGCSGYPDCRHTENIR